MLMTATAAPRRPPSHLWTRSMIRHVETTDGIVAQSSDSRKGRSTQTLPPMRAPTPRMVSVVRGMSYAADRVGGMSRVRELDDDLDVVRLPVQARS